jgi:hypothetical protein
VHRCCWAYVVPLPLLRSLIVGSSSTIKCVRIVFCSIVSPAACTIITLHQLLWSPSNVPSYLCNPIVDLASSFDATPSFHIFYRAIATHMFTM